MILSERELELGQDHAGIIVLDDGEPGTPLADVLPLQRRRPRPRDHGQPAGPALGLRHRARGRGALPASTSRRRRAATRSRAGDEPVDVTIEDFEGCPRYIGRLFRDVRIGPSPLWLRARLDAAGMRPISNVVDVTNYVMLGLGNPLHAFDHANARGRQDRRPPRAAGREAPHARRRRARARPLGPDDRGRGARRSRSPGSWAARRPRSPRATSDVLLEAANFEPTGLWRTSERLRLRTEGSNRWEKGVDPYLAEQAAAWATELIVELAGAPLGRAHGREGRACRSARSSASDPERASAFIGLEVAADEQHDLLDAARARARATASTSSRPGGRATSRARST